jgi:hypothetical protein
MAASNAGEYKTRRILAAMDDEIGVLKPGWHRMTSPT